MKTIILLFATMCCFLTANLAQNFAGQYHGEYNGDAVQLVLEPAGAKAWKGWMTDSQQRYTVSATSNGSKITGTAVVEALGITFDLSGQLQGQRLDLKLNFMGAEIHVSLSKNGAVEPSLSTGAAPKLPAHARHDKAVAGVWMRQENYNSGGMGGYFSSNTYLSFNADGTLSDLGGQTMMGTSDASGFSGQQGGGVVPGVKWYTDNNNLYLVATDGQKTETAKLGRYFIENGAMLITADDGTKALYYRK